MKSKHDQSLIDQIEVLAGGIVVMCQWVRNTRKTCPIDTQESLIANIQERSKFLMELTSIPKEDRETKLCIIKKEIYELIQTRLPL